MEDVFSQSVLPLPLSYHLMEKVLNFNVVRFQSYMVCTFAYLTILSKLLPKGFTVVVYGSLIYLELTFSCEASDFFQNRELIILVSFI